MTTAEPVKHLLDGFPDAALHFFRAMEQNRNRVATEHELSETDLIALFRIAASGSMTPKRLASDLSLTNGAITGVSSRLVAAGLIQRVAHPNDRRSFSLKLTSSGHTSVHLMHVEFRSMLAPDEGTVDDRDLAVTLSVMETLTAQMRARLTIAATAARS